MAKLVAPGLQVQREKTAAPDTHLNQYVELLWVVAAGGLGIALLCVAASIGLADTNSSASAALQSRGIVDLAVANVNTAQALTVEAFSVVLPELTIFPSNSPAVNPTLTITNTALFTPSVMAARTSIPLTRTRLPGEGFIFGTNTQIILPTQTRTAQSPPTSTLTTIPTETSTPSLVPTVITRTPRPTRTRTSTPVPVPTVITRTPRPTRTRTSTPVPVPTDTVTPVPTTEVPLPTTEIPPPTTEIPQPTTEVPPPTTEVPPPTTEVPPPTEVTP